MDIEEIYTILKGATRSPTGRASFENTLKWFTECGIIDGKVITEHMFTAYYEDLSPNRGELTLTHMICLFGSLYRHTRVPVSTLTKRFATVKDRIIEEIQEHWRIVDENHKTRVHSFNCSYHGSEDSDNMINYDF